VAQGKAGRGIVFCGSRVGATIVANSVAGVRAVNAYNEDIARQSREHGDCNVLALGGRYLDAQKAKRIVEIWLKTPFSGDERHQRRIRKIERS